MFLKSAAIAAGAAVMAFVAPQQAAAATFPVSVDTVPGIFLKPGPNPRPGREDATNAMSGPDGVFYSLGLGGLAVFDFGKVFGPQFVTIVETTFDCPGDFVCGNHEEIVDVLVSTSYLGGGDLTGFMPIAMVGNAEAIGDGATVTANKSFRYVALVDKSDPAFGSFDGFDIDAIFVTPIPLPAAGWMLVSAMIGMALLTRRSRATA